VVHSIGVLAGIEDRLPAAILDEDARRDRIAWLAGRLSLGR